MRSFAAIGVFLPGAALSLARPPLVNPGGVVNAANFATPVAPGQINAQLAFEIASKSPVNVVVNKESG
jgi:hypothetical protein